MMKISIFLVTFLLFNLFCFSSGQNERISNGEDAIKGEFPFLVHIQPKDGGYLRIVGTILNEWWILTTDDFEDLFPPFRYKIVAGEHDLENAEGSEQERFVAQVVPYYSGSKGSAQNYQKDILMIKVSEPFVFNEWVQPVTLALDGSINYNEDATIVGWGYTAYSGWYSNILQTASIPFVGNDDCQAKYQSSNWYCYVTNGMVCAGAISNKTGNCFGDYGAPILVKGETGYSQVGLYSWGYGCEDSWYPGVYTRVSSYESFIKSTLDGYLPPCNGFECADKSRCLPGAYECNQITECVDGSDEHSGCSCLGFRCASGNGCIFSSNECDGTEHCPDGSDEHANCKYWECDNGELINEDDWCDGMTHCTDNSDEQNCPCFECKDGSKCILPGWECDGFIDCPDGSDEHKDCNKGAQAKNVFKCGTGSKISGNKICNGMNDCGDWFDEANCTSKPARYLDILKKVRGIPRGGGGSPCQ